MKKIHFHKKVAESIYFFIPSSFEKKLKRVNLILRNKFYVKKCRKKLKSRDFSVVTNNCLAKSVYELFDMQNLSPTIGCFIPCSDFIKIVNNPKILTLPLVQDNFDPNAKVPMGKIGDVRIYFIHYKSFGEAKEKWERRVSRLNFEKIIFIMQDIKYHTFDFENIKELSLPNLKNFFFISNDINKKHIKNIVLTKKYLSKKSFYLGALELLGFGKKVFERYINLPKILKKLFD